MALIQDVNHQISPESLAMSVQTETSVNEVLQR